MEKVIDKFCFRSDIAISDTPRFLIYPANRDCYMKVADLYIPEPPKQPKLAISGQELFDYLARTSQKNIELEVPHQFVNSEFAKQVDSYLEQMMFAVNQFVESYKDSKLGFLFRVIVSVPLSDALKVTGTYTDAWKQALSPTARNVDYSLDFADGRLTAEMHFEDLVITSSQIRVLRFFADIIKFMFSGDDVKVLFDKFDKVNSLMSKMPSHASTFCDPQSWLIFDISEITKK